jgi:hypothetical protein
LLKQKYFTSEALPNMTRPPQQNALRPGHMRHRRRIVGRLYELVEWLRE